MLKIHNFPNEAFHVEEQRQPYGFHLRKNMKPQLLNKKANGNIGPIYNLFFDLRTSAECTAVKSLFKLYAFDASYAFFS